ncbi:MAG: aminotransferase class I/II-fold pyridoxal phosphate-dependent enzyme [SAR202 cluster bacterium]|nr:aminotransferase class I/II-fold pyridoxal phosphate-dependent enzyme [SAR202 cluster bacterium]
MTRVNNRYNAVNLAQGFPDFDPPKEIVQSAKQALDEGFHQYAITWGSPSIRKAIAGKFAWFNGVEVDPERHVTVVCGGTEAMMAAMLAVVDPGDEVIVFEPFYENYGPDALLAGGTPVFVPLRQHGGEMRFDFDELRRAFSKKTKAIVVNTPHNPTGKVFSLEEMKAIANLCIEHDVLALTDEPYEHIIFDGEKHVTMAALPGMARRTVTTNSASKTYSVTGWRVGWAIALDDSIATAIRRVHDFLSIGAAAPLQEAVAKAIYMPLSYYGELARGYQARRDAMVSILDDAGFEYATPKGAYYVMCRYPACGYDDDLAFSHFLSEEVGVTPVPGRAFYHDPELAKPYVRFAFPKKLETLERVSERMRRLHEFRK